MLFLALIEAWRIASKVDILGWVLFVGHPSFYYETDDPCARAKPCSASKTPYVNALLGSCHEEAVSGWRPLRDPGFPLSLDRG
ncbi:hypothetical protein Tco_0431910 [Tanacetum coccineum]